MEILLTVIFIIVCFLKYLEYLDYKERTALKSAMLSMYDSSKLPPAMNIQAARNIQQLGNNLPRPSINVSSDLPSLTSNKNSGLILNSLSNGLMKNEQVTPLPSKSNTEHLHVSGFDSWHNYHDEQLHDYDVYSQVDFSVFDVDTDFFTHDLGITDDSYFDDVTMH